MDSTNRYAADAARRGEPEGLVVVADHQVSGRGRRGRSWQAPPGGALLCTLLFRPRLALGDLHVLGPVVGLAALDAVRAAGVSSVSLKWPNDLVVEDRKLAGVLAEIVELPSPTASAAVVVGIGVNLSWPSGWVEDMVSDDGSSLATLATTVEEATGTAPRRDELLGSFLSRVEERYATLERGGIAALMADYRLECSTLGRLVEVTTEASKLVGRATGVADDGRLQVIAGPRTLLVDAADVVHLRNAP